MVHLKGKREQHKEWLVTRKIPNVFSQEDSKEYKEEWLNKSILTWLGLLAIRKINTGLDGSSFAQWLSVRFRTSSLMSRQYNLWLAWECEYRSSLFVRPKFFCVNFFCMKNTNTKNYQILLCRKTWMQCWILESSGFRMDKNGCHILGIQCLHAIFPPSDCRIHWNNEVLNI